MTVPSSAQPPRLNESFEKQLKKIGEISPSEFLRRYSVAPQGGLSWDPTTANYWKEMNTEPVDPGPRGIAKPDLRLNNQELMAFKKHGFVVSERLGRDTMTGLLYRVYSADLPVFVSADALLHAWHKSFNDVFASLEMRFLAPTLKSTFQAMHGSLEQAAQSHGEGEFKNSLRDADLLLTVALSLESGKQIPTVFGQDQDVEEVLAHCAALRPARVTIFGTERLIDFNDLTIRGRYEKYPQLHGYFRSVVWCRLTGLRILESKPNREFKTALVLAELLRRSGKGKEWRKFESVLDRLVGATDGLSLGQTLDLIGQAPLQDSRSYLRALVKTGLGREEIPLSRKQSPNPNHHLPSERVFFITGARHTMGSWLLSQTVYGRIKWRETRVRRKVPSALEVAFAALGNDSVVEELVRRIRAPGVAYRDGYNYQHNLAALRETIDGANRNVWECSIAAQWLATLRALSEEPDSRSPEVTKSKAWRLRLANSQLASWTQLRHTIVADAKPSQSDSTLCFYPTGYVEPSPEFWKRLESMSASMSQLGKETKTGGVEGFYSNFQATARRLRVISSKQIAGLPLEPAETKFLKDMVEIGPMESGGAHYTGWYFGLFFRRGGSRWELDAPETWEPVVADVHASPEDIDSPTMYLLEGTGAADMLVVAIENGADRTVYLGPTTSYYEWVSHRRVPDSEWKSMVERGQAPPRPSWTKDFLVTVE